MVKDKKNYYKRYYKENKDRIKKTVKTYEKIYRKSSSYKNKKRRKDINDAVNLSDRYIVKRIRESSGLSSAVIRGFPELIELERIRLKIKRLLKNKK